MIAVLLAPLALLFDRLVGYPDALVRRIGHPVMWMGALLSRLDRRLNQGPHRKAKGVLALVLLLTATLLASGALVFVCRLIPGWGLLLEAVLGASLLAQKSLFDAVKRVATGLRTSLTEGRAAVSHIVGRDPDQLDEAGVARAAIESLAESISDGVVAPLFWLIIGGVPGIALYKAVNTADSMIGHKNERYLEFGWAAARFDDLVNLIPARLSALLIALAARLGDGDAKAALEIARRDAPKHESPNAGWPEAAMAGALGFRLGGPRAYQGEIIDLPAFGDGRADLGPADIDRALRLYGRVLDILFVVVVAGAVLAALLR